MNYFGSKNAPGVYRQIINQIRPHDLFVECFAGSAGVSTHKLPAAENILIEANAKVIAAAQSRLTARSEQFSATAVHRFICGDVLRWLGPDSWLRAELFRRRAVVYLDPPYLLSSRSSRQLRYEVEFHTEKQHEALLAIVRKLPCDVIISHYRCELYDRRLKGWRRVDFRAGSRGGLKIESIYCNFPDPEVLHDYRFAGANKDRRQRLKRRIATLLRELADLPAVEANAIRAAVAVAENLRRRK